MNHAEQMPKSFRSGTVDAAEEHLEETSGVRRIPHKHADPFTDPEQKHRVALFATKEMLKNLEEEKKLLTQIVATEAHGEQAKEEYTKNPSPKKAKLIDELFSMLETFENLYKDEYIEESRTISEMRKAVSWNNRLERVLNEIEKQQTNLKKETRALERAQQSRIAPSQESASRR